MCLCRQYAGCKKIMGYDGATYDGSNLKGWVAMVADIVHLRRCQLCVLHRDLVFVLTQKAHTCNACLDLAGILALISHSFH